MSLSCFLILSLAVLSFAGKVVSYTATSNISQEEANNTAMAGVAKQISSQVKANQILTKEETSSGGKFQTSEKYRATSQVSSNVLIKGIMVTPVKTGTGFKAIATLDLDEYTADIQFKMAEIRENIAVLERSIDKAIGERQYARALVSIDEAKALSGEYEKLVDRLASVYPVNETHLLKHRLPKLESTMIDKLSQIRIEGPTETITISNSEMPPWSVRVYDSKGPVANFPLVARQGFFSLLERRTQADGSATFNLRKVNYEKGPYTIIIEPGFPDEILAVTGLRQKFELTYQVNRAKYPVRLKCDELANICNALEKALAQKSIFVEDNPSAPLLEFKVATSEHKAIRINDSTIRYSYNVDLSLKNSEISFLAQTKEPGKNATDATVKAIGKADFSSLQKKLKPHAK